MTGRDAARKSASGKWPARKCGVPLPTPSGFMTGSYGMVTADGEPFDIAIPTFSLDGPETKRTLN